uniref:ER membrane protein complex subunit 4 n=1 Tax=Blastobotrys adeninivorans TaxID=409370 RepID=A0A060TCY0_BLAAD
MGEEKLSPPQWYYDLTDTSSASPAGVPGIASPPGFTEARAFKKQQSKPISATEHDKLKVKKAWEMALAPGKALPMNLFMSYMSGNSLQIVPITMTTMMFFVTPFKQLFAVSSVFENFESKSNANDIAMAKIAYIACHLLTIAAGIWKLGMMGLLPNTRSDWLAWESSASVVEHAVM